MEIGFNRQAVIARTLFSISPQASPCWRTGANPT
jgi:hypothetical protein